MKIRRLQTIGKELIVFHIRNEPEAVFKCFWPEIYSYGKKEMEEIYGITKRYTAPHVLKLVLQIDVLFHAAKLTHRAHLSPDAVPDISLLDYYKTTMDTPYLVTIERFLNNRLKDNNHTIIEYDRYAKWFAQIKSPRKIVGPRDDRVKDDDEVEGAEGVEGEEVEGEGVEEEIEGEEHDPVVPEDELEDSLVEDGFADDPIDAD